MVVVVAGVLPVVFIRCGMLNGCGMHITRFGMRVARRRFVALSIAAVLIVVGGVLAPVSMISFPIMKTCLTVRIKIQPDMVGPQIIILVAHHADKFSAVPDIIIGNTDIHVDGRWRDGYDGGLLQPRVAAPPGRVVVSRTVARPSMCM